MGDTWEDRMVCRDSGVLIFPMLGGYIDDEDHGEWFLYTGSGGRDLSGNKRVNKNQSFNQQFEKMNEALRVSCHKGYPVRVVRSHKEKRSSYAPEAGVRYDGVYRILKCCRKKGIQVNREMMGVKDSLQPQAEEMEENSEESSGKNDENLKKLDDETEVSKPCDSSEKVLEELNDNDLNRPHKRRKGASGVGRLC